MKPLPRLVLGLISFTVIGYASLTATSETVQLPKEDRRAVVARARVWMPTNVPAMNLALGPQGPGSFEQGATVECDYLDKKLDGRSPKFACQLPDGQEVKVKYGGANGEVFSEVAASRLLWALGFGADHMYPVQVVCRGCPDRIGSPRGKAERLVNPATIERKLGEELFDKWDWDELEDIDESAGGSIAAERDAFKLVAVLLQHSDSKPEQQRVVCLQPLTTQNGVCERPLIMIQDLGVTFGRANAFNQQPRASANLADWAKVPIWKGSGSCIGKLSGSITGTLEEPVITEGGRAFLAKLLDQLSDAQLRDMFTVARFDLRKRDPDGGRPGLSTIDEWVDAFKQKRQEISERRCP